MPNLETYALGCISDAIYGMDTLATSDLGDLVSEQISSAVDSVCIYTSDCLDIISRYDREVDDSDIEDFTSEQTFKASQWQEAMTAYAAAVAYAWLSHRTSELVSEIDTASDLLAEQAPDDAGEPRISRDCPHGWAVHDREDEHGIHYWSPPHLEGCAAVAVQVAGVWLSYTWTPEPSQDRPVAPEGTP